VSEQPRVLAELGAELHRVARDVLGDAPARREPSLAGRLRRRWRTLPVVVLIVLGGAAVAFASGLFSFGAPVASTPIFSNADIGLGAVTPGSVKLLSITTPDPQGGPPWGLRVLRTTREAGCVQVGRLVDGKLVALGQDGAFANDGRAHQLPVSAAVTSFGCTPLDSNGEFFNSVTMLDQTASAAWWFGATTCAPTGTLQPARRKQPECPLAEERDVYYGVLGPDAKSISYTLDGRTRTQATTAPDGAYLIVTDASAHQRILNLGVGTADDVPVFSPISSIHYTNGATCHLLTADKWIVGFHACSPTLKEPIGYVPVPAPTTAQVAAPIHARVIYTHVMLVPAHEIQTAKRTIHIRARAIPIPPQYEVIVSFRSRIALRNLRGQYELEWHNPREPARVDSYTTIGGSNVWLARGEADLGVSGYGADIAIGQNLTATLGQLGPKLAPGTVRGTITLRYSTGPSLDGDLPTKKIPVGSFTATIP